MSGNGKRLKVGVVGAGIAHSADGRENFAVRAHLPALKALKDLFEVTAVCTTRMESAGEAASRFDVPNAFDNVDEMLSKVPELDIVCVSVRPASHYEVAMSALRAGKHVYCEHPGGTSTEQARNMWELAEKNGLRSMTGHQGHFDAACLYMAELVRQGYLGTPLSFGMSHFGANYITPRPYFHRWLFDQSAGGRPAYRSGHSFERLMAILGQDVTSVCANFTIKVPERPALDQPGTMLTSNQVDNMNYLLKTGDGAVGTLQVSLTAWSGTGDGFEVYGTDGMLMLVDARNFGHLAQSTGEKPPSYGYSKGSFLLFGMQANIDRILNDKLPPEELDRFAQLPIPAPDLPVALDSKPAQGVVPAWMEFAAAIREGREAAPSLHDTYKIHRIWDASEESERTKTWVGVDYT